MHLYQKTSHNQTPLVYRPLTPLASVQAITTTSPSSTPAVSLTHPEPSTQITQPPQDTPPSTPIPLTPSPAQLPPFPTSIITTLQPFCPPCNSTTLFHTTHFLPSSSYNSHLYNPFGILFGPAKCDRFFVIPPTDPYSERGCWQSPSAVILIAHALLQLYLSLKPIHYLPCLTSLVNLFPINPTPPRHTKRSTPSLPTTYTPKTTFSSQIPTHSSPHKIFYFPNLPAQLPSRNPGGHPKLPKHDPRKRSSLSTIL